MLTKKFAPQQRCPLFHSTNFAVCRKGLFWALSFYLIRQSAEVFLFTFNYKSARSRASYELNELRYIAVVDENTALSFDSSDSYAILMSMAATARVI